MTFEELPFGRRTIIAGVAALASGFAIGNVLGGTSEASHHCEESVTLVVAREIDGGIVCVDVKSQTVEVTYRTADPWHLVETHLAIGDDLDEFEEAGWTNPAGQPRPGRFPYRETHDPPVEAYTYEISFDELAPFSWPVTVAAHASVVADDGGRNEEGAWGEGERFVDRGSWGMYFEFDGGVTEIVGIGETAAGTVLGPHWWNPI